MTVELLEPDAVERDRKRPPLRPATERPPWRPANREALVEHDDPMEADRAYWESLTPEQEAAALNECSDYMGAAYYHKAENGELVRDREAEEQERRLARGFEKLHLRSTLRLALRRRSSLPLILRAMARPRSSRRSRVLRVRSRGSSSASRDGPGEPEPPPLDPDLAEPGIAGRFGVELG